MKYRWEGVKHTVDRGLGQVGSAGCEWQSDSVTLVMRRAVCVHSVRLL